MDKVLNNVLSDLPAGLLAQLFTNARPRKIQSGEMLFAADDPGDGCYRLESGLLKVYVASDHGEERIIAILGPGSIVGELSMIDGESRSASVVAIENSRLSFVTRHSFLRSAKDNPEIYAALVKILSARLRETVISVAATSFLSAKGRIARALLDLGKHLAVDAGADQIVLKHNISQEDIAAMAGVARENVSRALSDWRKRKIVTRQSGYYCINHVKLLEREAHFEKSSSLRESIAP